jgi:organic radical activating enzyme
MTSNVYCTAPFNGLDIGTDGILRTCCKGKTKLLNLKNIGTEDLPTALLSSKLGEIQQFMLEGKPHPENCNICEHYEQLTRYQFNTYFPKVDHNRLITPRFVLLRWSNFCNLSCVYCNDKYSSVWENRIQISTEKKFNDNFDNIYKLIFDNLDDIEELELQGGEPLLEKKNYDLLRSLPNKTKILIQTNLAYDLENLPCISDLLKRPKNNIIWLVSVDNIGKQFEYVRNGAKWDQWKKNCKYLVKHWPDTLHVSFVYNIFSAFEICNTIKYLSYLGLKQFQLLNFHYYFQYQKAFNIFNMPNEIKSKALDQLVETINWYQNFIHPEDKKFYQLTNADDILNKLNSHTDKVISKQEFFHAIDKTDTFCKNKFETLWPELKSLIDLHLH